MSGKLIFSYGTVCSGKTFYLLNVCFNYEKVGWKVCTIKPSIDSRSAMIETRAGVPPRKPDISIDSSEFISDYNDVINLADVILVDECQFLTKSQIEELRCITVERNIDVLCFGLRTDSNTHLFEASKRLFELADELIEVKTVCSVCGKHAGFNKKVFGDNDKLIDPSWDAFEQTCYLHFRD